jgi:hypothetical protein
MEECGLYNGKGCKRKKVPPTNKKDHEKNGEEVLKKACRQIQAFSVCRKDLNS